MPSSSASRTRDCQLKRLEISRKSERPIVYTTDFPPSTDPITVSLENKQQGQDEASVMVLLAHRGNTPLISIKLSDLLSQPHRGSQSVSVDTSVLQLRITVENQESAVYATFEKVNDFNLVVCLLAEIGFSTGSHIALNDWQVDSRAVIASRSRLSSVPPVTFSRNFQAQRQVSNPQDEPPSVGLNGVNRSLWPDYSAQYRPPASSPQSWPSSSPTASSPQSLFMGKQEAPTHSFVHLSPYQVFARPRYVSSPLRTSHTPQHLKSSPIYPELSLLTTDPTLLSPPIGIGGPLPSLTAFSDPERPVESDGPFLYPGNLAKQPLGSKEIKSIRDEQARSAQNPTDFRCSMPPPRSLPFGKETHTSLRTAVKETEDFTSVNSRKKSAQSSPIIKKPRSVAQRGRPANSKRIAKAATSQPKAKTSDAHHAIRSSIASASCQTELNSVNKPNSLATTGTSRSVQVSLDIEVEAGLCAKRQSGTLRQCSTGTSPDVPPYSVHETLMLWAEDWFLDKMNVQTGKLLDQLQVDIDRGLDRNICARFYMDQVFQTRRDMYHTYLTSSASVLQR